MPVSNGTGHGAGTGTITVPAGSFTAQLFEVDVTLPGPQPFPRLAKTPGPPIQERTTYWLVDKIGIVRVLQTSDGSPFIQELQQYHLVS